ncbi:hypothetical protein TNCV_646661, partial [Trichonephila clavipes]
YTRAFGDGPHNFEHGQLTWTTPELAPPSPNYHTHQWRTFQLSTDFNASLSLWRVFSGIGLQFIRNKASHDQKLIPFGYRGLKIRPKVNL